MALHPITTEIVVFKVKSCEACIWASECNCFKVAEQIPGMVSLNSSTIAIAGLGALLFLSQRSEAEPPNKQGPQTLSSSAHNTKTIDVTLRQSKDLTNANGRIPEQQAAQTLARVFKDIEMNYDIRYNYPAVNSPSENTGSNSGNLRWFKDKMDAGEFGYVANDVNLLLLNTRSGGVSYLYGKYGIVNAADITAKRPFQEAASRTDGHHQALYAILHEAGHQLGAKHLRDEDPGPDVFADAWIDSQNRFHKTPNYGGPTTNACGKQLPAQHSPVILHLNYSDCAKKHLHVV